MIGIEMKLNIPVHYQMGNPLQKNLISMYYVETRADNSGYTNHRVIFLAVIFSSFDSEQVFQVDNSIQHFI
jgi:hypothetical protein